MAGWPDPEPDSASEAVAYQIDAAHSGTQPGDSLSLPLALRWSKNFAGDDRLSYPLVASGRVFLTMRDRGSFGAVLIALDERSGEIIWGPASLGSGTFPFAGATYALGRVFAVNAAGLLQAFDAATGQALWLQQLDQHDFDSPPTAFGRRIYVGGAGSGGTLYAVNGANGAVLWHRDVNGGDESSPVVAPGGVFVGYACSQDFGYDTVSGTLLWHHDTFCSGAGGHTMALLGSRLYGRDSNAGNVVLDPVSGDLLGTFTSSTIPAGTDTVVYTAGSGSQSGGGLTAVEVGNPTPRWQFGDRVTSAPMVIGSSLVVVGQRLEDSAGNTSGEIDVLDAGTGALLSSFSVPDEIPEPDELGVPSSLTGFAVADDRLFVPTDSTLYVF